MLATWWFFWPLDAVSISVRFVSSSFAFHCQPDCPRRVATVRSFNPLPITIFLESFLSNIYTYFFLNACPPSLCPFFSLSRYFSFCVLCERMLLIFFWRVVKWRGVVSRILMRNHPGNLFPYLVITVLLIQALNSNRRIFKKVLYLWMYKDTYILGSNFVWGFTLS